MNVRSALMSLFQMMMGKFYFKEMKDSNSAVAFIYFIPFVLIFFYIIINFFSVSYLSLTFQAIIMRTYDNLR